MTNKTCFFKKVLKIDKLLAMLRKREKTQLRKIRNDTGLIIDTIDIQVSTQSIMNNYTPTYLIA